MTPLRPIWTRRTAAVSLFLLVFASSFLFISLEPSPEARVVCSAILALVAVLAVGFDPFVGLVVGLTGAALLTFVKNLFGWLIPETLILTAGEVILMVVIGAASAFVGSILRRLASGAQAAGAGPVFGSLGLLDGSLGEMRLREELDRATRYDRPLSIIRISVEPENEVAARDVGRAAARAVESILRLTDVPFAYDDTTLVAILPETPLERGLIVISRLSDALASASVTSRSSGVRRRLLASARVRICVVAFPEHGATDRELLAACATAASLHNEEPRSQKVVS